MANGDDTDPTVGWVDDPYQSQQTVPQTAFDDTNLWDTGPSWWQSNMPSWLGGGVSPVYDASGNPTSTGLGLTSGGSGGGNINASQISKALGDLQKGLQGDQKDGGGGQQRAVQAQAGSAQSGTGQGSAAGINGLINLLLSKSNQYFPGQPNPNPVALKRPSGGGLLGL